MSRRAVAVKVRDCHAPMRPPVYFLLTLISTLLLSCAAALALPTVKFKATAVPIPGFLHTGYMLGAGTSLRAEYEIEGDEYAGFAPPLVGVNFYLPPGAKLHPAGFPTCAKTIIEQVGPKGCTSGSHAGPTGRATGIVSFGGERVEEQTTIESFYSPEGGIEFFTDGHSPTSVEVLSSGHYVNLGGAGGYGPELVTQIPLVSTVPGAPYASVQSVAVEAGSAYRSHGRAVYYGQVPTSCPRSGFPVKTELTFDREGADPIVPETVTVAYRVPCPRK